MGRGRGRGRPGAPLSQPAQPVPSLVSSQASLPLPGKVCLAKSSKFRTLADAVCQKEAHDSGKWLFVPLPQGKGVGRRALGEPKEDLLAPRLAPSAGVLGTSVAPCLGLAASSSSLEGTGGWQSLQCRGLFTPPPRGSATAWPPVSPTHQRPAPRAPSGAADPAAGPARAPDSARSDCVPVVLAVSHGGSAPPSNLGSRRSPLIPSSWALAGLR